LWQLNTYRSRALDDLDEVVDWLKLNLPPAGPIGIMHGDYSMFNVMFNPTTPPSLAAIIDWDTATIGEVLMDMGHVLARWDDPGEAASALGSSDIADRNGLATRAELAKRFADRTNFDISHLHYYQVLSLFKLACIMEGHYANYMRSPTGDMGPFIGIGPALLSDAARIARGERR
jgi:aminoglycoside phosphotransferase (APT) family kinase protein